MLILNFIVIKKLFNTLLEHIRKIKPIPSPLFNVSRKIIHFSPGRVRFYCVCLFLVSSFSRDVIAADHKTITFNIPRQKADLALISFAEQADITLLFPFEQLEGKQVNPILGKYKVLEALDILLKDTGLILVSIDPERDTPEKLKPYLKYFGEEFSAITGDLEQITLLSTELNAFFKKAPLNGVDGQGGVNSYLVDHSANIAIINPDGKYQGYLKAPFTVPQLINDYQVLRQNF